MAPRPSGRITVSERNTVLIGFRADADSSGDEASQHTESSDSDRARRPAQVRTTKDIPLPTLRGLLGLTLRDTSSLPLTDDPVLLAAVQMKAAIEPQRLPLSGPYSPKPCMLLLTSCS